MKSRFEIWIRGLLAVIAIWLLAIFVFRAVGSMEPSAEDLRDWLGAQAYAGLSTGERRIFVESYAERLNRLSLEERRALRRYPEFEKSFREMTEDERVYFVEATLPRGIEQLIQAFNEMDKETRTRTIERAMQDLSEAEDAAFEQPGQSMDDGAARRIVENGLQIYYEEASPDARLQLAPLMEQLQRRMQKLR